MLYTYQAITQTGEKTMGDIQAPNVDVAISTLQKKGLTISAIHAPSEKKGFILDLSFFNKVSTKDVVILSRQLATLFQAQVSALRIFRLIGEQVENKILQAYLFDVADTIQGGSPISTALAKHPDAFSDFYVNMVRAGEESGKLDETFNYLADYMDRTYAVVSKAKSALIYPSFVIMTFIGVMVMMLTFIIPKISVMLTDSGQAIPFYTKVVLGMSNVFVNYGLYLLIAVLVSIFGIWRYSQSKDGAEQIDRIKLFVPYVGDLYHKLYLSRIADNLNTMIISGIPILRALEITSSVIDNKVYKAVLDDALIQVKGGSSLSAVFSTHKEIPGIMVQMIKVGEETGELGSILKTLSKFYDREVTNSVDTLVSLIEPIMIVALGLGVGILLASVLMPIYNIASAN